MSARRTVLKSRYQPTTQPDFGGSFHTENRAPLRYETRRFCANGKHDVIYISSYIHDAEFRLDSIYERGRSVVIPCRRVRWELFRHVDELLYISSEITISSVTSFDVDLGAAYTLTKAFLRKPQLIVSSLEYVKQRQRRAVDGVGRVVIRCTLDSKLIVQVGEGYKIRVLDSR